MGRLYTPVNIDNDCYAQAKQMGELLKWSGKQFVEEAIKAIKDLVESPKGQRQLPQLVALLDAAREHQRKAEIIAPKPKIERADQVPVKPMNQKKFSS